MSNATETQTPQVIAYLRGFKPQAKQGLYSFTHYENEQGDWIQMPLRMQTQIAFKRKCEVDTHRFDTYEQLCGYIHERITQEENN